MCSSDLEVDATELLYCLPAFFLVSFIKCSYVVSVKKNSLMMYVLGRNVYEIMMFVM